MSLHHFGLLALLKRILEERRASLATLNEASRLGRELERIEELVDLLEQGAASLAYGKLICGSSLIFLKLRRHFLEKRGFEIAQREGMGIHV